MIYCICYLIALHYFIVGGIIYYTLLKRGYNSFVRVMGTALGLYLGFPALLGLIFMKGVK